MIIRKAEKRDIPELTEIYNYEVRNGVATLDIHEKTITEREVWFNAHTSGNHILIVSEDNGKVTGYASLSPYREKEAYSSTVELSVYVAPDCREKGVASELLSNILEFAKNDPATHLVVSVITAGNDASVHLHEKFGFTYCGTIHQVGVKFGKYFDIVNYELITD